MKHEKYLLILDTYATSTRNVMYGQQHSSIEDAMDYVATLDRNDQITFERNGFNPVKIYGAYIYRNISGTEYERAMVSHDGRTWERTHERETYLWGLRSFDPVSSVERDADARI